MKCEKCGDTIEKKAKFCPTCGSEININFVDSPNTIISKHKVNPIIMPFILIALVLIVAAFTLSSNVSVKYNVSIQFFSEMI